VALAPCLFNQFPDGLSWLRPLCPRVYFYKIWVLDAHQVRLANHEDGADRLLQSPRLFTGVPSGAVARPLATQLMVAKGAPIMQVTAWRAWRMPGLSSRSRSKVSEHASIAEVLACQRIHAQEDVAAACHARCRTPAHPRAWQAAVGEDGADTGKQLAGADGPSNALAAMKSAQDASVALILIAWS
jgi:hypothetical protein